jgi:hypothetical protein
MRAVLLILIPHAGEALLSIQPHLYRLVSVPVPSPRRVVVLQSIPVESESPSSSERSIDSNNALLQVPDSGSHDELMYALGVNLARQLGDVRPLVETPQEMSLLAKGLLDTVVGRLTDDEQRALLLRRGQELNQVIVDRA